MAIKSAPSLVGQSSVLRAWALALGVLLGWGSAGCVAPTQTPRITPGTFEVRLGGDLSRLEQRDSDTETDELHLAGELLYVLHPRFQLGPIFRWTQIEETLDGVEIREEEQASAGVRGVFNILTEGQVQPYLGAGIGVTRAVVDRGFLDDDDQGWFWQGSVGSRFLWSNRAAFFAEFQFVSTDLDAGVGDESERFAGVIGFSVFFGRLSTASSDAEEATPN